MKNFFCLTIHTWQTSFWHQNRSVFFYGKTITSIMKPSAILCSNLGKQLSAVSYVFFTIVLTNRCLASKSIVFSGKRDNCENDVIKDRLWISFKKPIPVNNGYTSKKVLAEDSWQPNCSLSTKKHLIWNMQSSEILYKYCK